RAPVAAAASGWPDAKPSAASAGAGAVLAAGCWTGAVVEHAATSSVSAAPASRAVERWNSCFVILRLLWAPQADRRVYRLPRRVTCRDQAKLVVRCLRAGEPHVHGGDARPADGQAR